MRFLDFWPWRRLTSLWWKRRQRAIVSKIEKIRAIALEQIADLERLMGKASSPGNAWIPVVKRFYERLHALASDGRSSPADAMRLSQEANRYLVEAGDKGVFVGVEAKQLSRLLARYQSLEEKHSATGGETAP